MCFSHLSSTAIVKCSSNKICKTKECLRSAADLLQSMNIQVDPCEDFYKFTCGQWPDIHPRWSISLWHPMRKRHIILFLFISEYRPDSASSHDWFNEKQTKIFRKIRDFLQMNDTDDDPLPVQQTRMMYKACMDTGKCWKCSFSFFLHNFRIPLYPLQRQWMNSAMNP